MSILGRLAPPRLALPLLMGIGALLFIVNLGCYPLYTKGEPREALTIFDIVHGGGVILPMRARVEISVRGFIYDVNPGSLNEIKA